MSSFYIILFCFCCYTVISNFIILSWWWGVVVKHLSFSVWFQRHSCGHYKAIILDSSHLFPTCSYLYSIMNVRCCGYQIPILKLEKLPELKGNINRSDDSKQVAKLLDLRKTKVNLCLKDAIYLHFSHSWGFQVSSPFVSLVACTKQTCF